MSAAHRPLSAWRYVESECRNPKEIGSADPRRTLTWSDVRSALEQVGIPPATVDGPAYTLVHLRTTFYTTAGQIEHHLRILGYGVDVVITPAHYFWFWGDGHRSTTTVPGAPYPSTAVTHAYAAATPVGRPVTMRVDVAYRCRFSVDDGHWVPVNDELVIPGHPRALPIKQASGVLVPLR